MIKARSFDIVKGFGAFEAVGVVKGFGAFEAVRKVSAPLRPFEKW